jgi:hypothetical protein
MATPNSPNDLTRQQLDELDTLLQRMLALPLNKPETVVMPPLAELPLPPEPSPHAVPEPMSWPPEPLLARPSFLTLAPEPEAAAEYAPRPTEHRSMADLLPFPIPDGPLPGDTGTLRGVDFPATPDGFRSAYAPRPDGSPSDESVPFLAPAPDPSAGPAVRTPPPAASGVGLFTPVAVLNRCLEGVLDWCGPLGHWLTRPPVKHLLGYTGLILMTAAAAWVARGMGWVSWPD